LNVVHVAFEWERFFEQNGIPFATGGSNVSRGNVAIHCPFCGAGDEGQHMSVNLNGRGWRCFRRPDHRGKGAARLVQALINCTWERAKHIVGEAVYIPEDFNAQVHKLLTPPAPPIARKLVLPDNFKPIKQRWSAGPYLDYLTGPDRNFTMKQALRLTDWYDMRYATQGPYKRRVVFPIYFGGKLVSWSGRAIDKQTEIRYKTLSDDPERAEREGVGQAIGPITDYLLWYDDAMEADADTIVICEGPFDACKVDVLGRSEGIVATSVFTSRPTNRQIELLHALLPRYKHRLLLLDRGTLPTMLRVQGELTGLGLQLAELPRSLKDPGEFKSRKQLVDFILDNKH
jgi:hypothetical protein